MHRLNHPRQRFLKFDDSHVLRRACHVPDLGCPSGCHCRLMDGGELWERISRCWSSLLTSDGLGTVDARTGLKPGAPENLQQARREANKNPKQTKPGARTAAGWHVPIDIWGKNLEAHRWGTQWRFIASWTARETEKEECSTTEATWPHWSVIGRSLLLSFYKMNRKSLLNVAVLAGFSYKNHFSELIVSQSVDFFFLQPNIW